MSTMTCPDCGADVSKAGRRCHRCANLLVMASRRMTRDLAWVMERVTVDPVTGCWNWGRCTNKQGYGLAGDGRRVRLAHVLVYEIVVGPVPEGQEATHGCDNPSCVRPHADHVRPGTRSFNLREAYERGLRRRPIFRNPNVRGITNPNAKLTASDLAAIRQRLANGESQTSIARDFLVRQPQISRIARRVAHINE